MKIRSYMACSLLGVSMACARTGLAVPFAYVTHAHAPSAVNAVVSVIDTKTESVIAIASVGTYPRIPVVHPNGRAVFIPVTVPSGIIGAPTTTALDILDAFTNMVVRRAPAVVGHLAISPDGNDLFTTDGDHTFFVLDTESLSILAEIPTERYPTRIAVSPDGRRAFVMNPVDSDPEHHCDVFPLSCETRVTVIDLFNRRPLEPVRNVATAYLRDIAADPRGQGFYTIGLARLPEGGSDNVLSFARTDESTVSKRIRVPGGANQLAVHPSGVPVYVLNGSNLVVIDPDAETVLADIPIGQTPMDLAVTPDGSAVYVLEFDTDVIKIIDTATNQVTGTIPVVADPIGIAIGPDVPITPLSTPTCPDVTPPSCPTDQAMLCNDSADRCNPDCACATYTPTVTATPIPGLPCPADCNGDRRVTVNELVLGVSIALGEQRVDACVAIDCHHSQCGADLGIGIDCLVRAVGHALEGCPIETCHEMAECDDDNSCTRDECRLSGCLSTCICQQ